MWNRIWRVTVPANRHDSGAKRQSAPRSRRMPCLEVLEDRQLMTASLAPISNLTVPAQLGYQVPLNGSGSNSPTQTFTATSSNPDIKVSVAQGQFWTLTVSHQPANSSDVTINNETMTFQLFQDLTPNTVDSDHQPDQPDYYTQRLPEHDPAGARRPVHPADHFGGQLGLRRRPGRVEQPDQHRLIERDSADRHRARSATCLHRSIQIAMANTGAAQQHRRPVLHHQRRSLDLDPAGLRLQLHHLRPACFRASKR